MDTTFLESVVASGTQLLVDVMGAVFLLIGEMLPILIGIAALTVVIFLIRRIMRTGKGGARMH